MELYFVQFAKPLVGIDVVVFEDAEGKASLFFEFGPVCEDVDLEFELWLWEAFCFFFVWDVSSLSTHCEEHR
ncbi:hypothetical protein AVEN_187822-1, partial [Araneus ventricosus]